jgi:hypothetical protein
MLTPAEELGLSGLSLASRVRKAFFKIPEAQLRELMDRLREAAVGQRFFYYRDNVPETVHILACPITVLPFQLSYIHSVSHTIQNALKRLPDMYLQDEAVREVLRLTPGEEDWLRECWDPAHGENNPIFGRQDAMVDFISPMWKDSLRYVEPNLSGVGGLNIVPGSERLFADMVLPVLQAQDGELRLETCADLRELLLQEITDHMQALGRPARHICFVEPKYVHYGPEDQAEVAKYYRDRHGLKVLHADPAELSLDGAEVYYDGVAVDVVYRDYAVIDLLTLEGKGVDVRPMRELFRQNRVISSIAAELDQKSCWEILTDPSLTQKYFRADERRIFRRHILWTRVVSDRATTLPTGGHGGLLNYIRRERERLVLKPNRAYGGEGVTLGHLLTQQEWEATLERALNDPSRWVVQELASIPVSEFPVLGTDGSVHIEPFYAVMGFAPTPYGLAVMGRASQKQVVNVAQRGGLCIVLTGRPPSPLHGPSST